MNESNEIGKDGTVAVNAEANSTGSKTDYQSAYCVHEIFERQAAKSPHALAIIHNGRQYTYAELNASANQLAHYLRSLDVGIGPDKLVAIAAERSIEMIISLLAVLKAGGAYVPLDPAAPPERISQVLRDSAVNVVIAQNRIENLSKALLAEGPKPHVIDFSFAASEVSVWSEQPKTNPARKNAGGIELTTEHLAYVIYTSGSTGVPKGVMVPHRAVNRLVINGGYAKFGADDHVAFAANPAFDAATMEVWGPLLNGGSIVVIDQAILLDPKQFGATLKRDAVTTLWLTVGLFNQYADSLIDEIKGLRYLIVGGDVLDPRILARVLRNGAPQHLVNGYGPTETTTFACTYEIQAVSDDARSIPIGRPISNTQIYILDAHQQPIPLGEVGEIYIGGAGVARGYLNRPDLTKERFLPDPFSAAAGGQLYKTGDLGQYLPDGNIEFLGRNDHQVKIRGFRVELGEIEARVGTYANVRQAIVLVREDKPGVKRIVAYYTASVNIGIEKLRAHLAASLPDYMVPSAYVQMPVMPITANGKLDRAKLPAPSTARPEMSVPFQMPVGPHETICCQVFASILGIDAAGRRDNFFELGGNSLLAVSALEQIRQKTGVELSAPTIFARPTPAELAAEMDAILAPVDHERGECKADAWISSGRSQDQSSATDRCIAVIGMAGRFPGANSIEALWENLRAGRDSITRFDNDTLDVSVSAALRHDPNYVSARGVIEGVENFDAAFFGIPPREAEVMDPQHRVFLEIAWECLERAGYAPDRTTCPVGVFAGMHATSYLQNHVMAHPDAIEKVGEFLVMVGNEKDYVPSRVAYKLNLKGPAVSVNTACSTSLVAIAQAVDSLRLGRCDMALAGAAAVTSPYRTGYLYQEGAMLSADGSTRTFDANATGTAFNDGAAVVLLKRLDDAISDGDQIFAVIRGIATNNDGGGKASFTAPSVDGQAAVIAAAHRDADVDASTISYVEAHGTATPLGDPVEIEGLTRAFMQSIVKHNAAGGKNTPLTGFCRIGSIKSNIGHLVAAAGATGVIKTAMSLKHELIPASIHYKAPNPKINFAASPFVVNDTETVWARTNAPRRAGVSSFGVGGTNAHAVLEEAPLVAASTPNTGAQLLRLSARSRSALAESATQLANHLAADPAMNLADIAWTLDIGRSRFAHRLVVAADSVASAMDALRTPDSAWRAQRELPNRAAQLVFLFPGQGAQYAGMGRGLYESEPVFRAAFDTCIDALKGTIDFDLKQCIFNGGAESLSATATTQPATFCLEYALAQLWLSRRISQGGILKPVALIGHSVGEFVAAVLAGVMSVQDAVQLVAKRGAMMQALPTGSMLSVRMAASKLESLLPADVSLAAENSPNACVVAGPMSAIEKFSAALERDGVMVRLLQTSHAFHSAMMTEAIAPFEALVRKVKLSAPTTPIISTLTGTWMTAAEATDPNYWARHLREPVRFSPAIRTALAERANEHMETVFLEIGPRGTLSTLARQHSATGQTAPVAFASLADKPELEALSVELAVGNLWAIGIELDARLEPNARRLRVRLPTYPFERKRFWLDAQPASVAVSLSTNLSKPILSLSTLSINAAITTPSVELTPMTSLQPTASTSPSPSPLRRSQLVERLRTMFEDVAGTDLSGADPTTTFIELGLDSLTLTQAAIQLKKNFAVKITFRQLMESYRSFETLAEYLDGLLPPDAAPVVASMPAIASVVTPAIVAGTVPIQPFAASINMTQATAPVGGTFMQQVIQQQMQLMSQQLAMLGGQAPVAFAAPAPVVAQPSITSNTASNSPLPISHKVTAAEETSAEPAEIVKPITYDVKKAFGAIARIHTQGNQLNDRQRMRLEAFMRRYVERTKKSKAYTAEHRPHLADPRVVNNFRPQTKEIIYQIVIERSKGAKMWDLDGNEYVDVLNGFGMCLFGWQADFIQHAVRKQLDLGYDIGPMHPLAGDVAKLICELTGFDRAGLCNTGSEAVMAAIRIARTVTGRNLMVVFAGSYHGTFDEVIVRAGRNNKGIPAAPGIMPEAFGNVVVLDYGTPESLEFIRQNADDLAAVLVEPVQSRRPDFQPKEYLREIRAITEKSSTCLIFDEVITGFRAHVGGVQALFGIRADLATYGKVIGGGYPIGAIAGKREYMDALDGGAWQYGDDSMPTVGVTYFAGTFVRHPLALAAAKAALEHIKECGPQLQTDLTLRTAAMADELNAFCVEAGAPIVIKSFASLWRATFTEDHPLQDLLFAMMRNRGVHILDNFPCFFTTAHTADDVAIIKTAFKESVIELQEADLLPKRKDESASTLDSSKPPVPGARIGKDPEGNPAWFVPNPNSPGKYLRLDA